MKLKDTGPTEPISNRATDPLLPQSADVTISAA